MGNGLIWVQAVLGRDGRQYVQEVTDDEAVELVTADSLEDHGVFLVERRLYDEYLQRALRLKETFEKLREQPRARLSVRAERPVPDAGAAPSVPAEDVPR